MDANNWDFNCPQFIDFSGPNVLAANDEADKYFDFDHENGVPVKLNELSPQKEIIEAVNVAEACKTPNTPRLTRSAKGKTPAQEDDKPQPRKTPRATRSKSMGVLTPDVANEVKSATPGSQRVTRSLSTKTPVTQEAEKPKPSSARAKSATRKTGNELEATKKEPDATKKAPDSTKKEPVANSNKRNYRSLERSDSLPKRLKTNAPERGRTPNKSTPSKSSCLQRSSSFSTVHNKSSGAHKRGYSGDRSASKPRSGSTSSNKSDSDKPKSTMTVPTTPTFMRRKPIKMVHHEPLKTSEQREMETIAFYKKELAKKRKEAQDSLKVALSGKGPTHVPAMREPTRPQEFRFETDTRVKTHAMETRTDCGNKGFEQMLRAKSDPKQTSAATKSGPTVPEPFHLTSQRKRKLPDLDEKQAEKYESMAQRIKAFTATPERFRSKPKGEVKRGRSRSPPHGVTIPKTPQFETRTRSRPVAAPTREDLEKKEIEEAQKNQFKAKPVNHRILDNPNCGVKRVPRKPLTVCSEFALTSNAKKMDRSAMDKEEHYEFHAQPLNKKILEGTVGVKSPRRMPVTMPASPAFALKNRVRMPQEQDSKEEKPVLRSRLPHYGIPFQPQLGHKTTQPKPFGFEERDKRKAEEKMRHIEQIIEDENRRDFHANPLPDLEPHLPPKITKPLTVKQPFNMETEKRGMRKAEEWSQKLEEELRQQKESARFKAAEPLVLEKKPFVPKHDTKFTTEFSEFELNTAKRVSKREVFEGHLKAKQDQLDNIRRQEQLMREAEEAAELERLRHEAVPRAQPVKHYKPVAVKPSQKPLTAPMSPAFKTDSRLRSRNMHNSSSNLSV